MKDIKGLLNEAESALKEEETVYDSVYDLKDFKRVGSDGSVWFKGSEEPPFGLMGTGSDLHYYQEKLRDSKTIAIKDGKLYLDGRPWGVKLGWY